MQLYPLVTFDNPHICSTDHLLIYWFVCVHCWLASERASDP